MSSALELPQIGDKILVYFTVCEREKHNILYNGERREERLIRMRGPAWLLSWCDAFDAECNLRGTCEFYFLPPLSEEQIEKLNNLSLVLTVRGYVRPGYWEGFLEHDLHVLLEWPGLLVPFKEAHESHFRFSTPSELYVHLDHYLPDLLSGRSVARSLLYDIPTISCPVKGSDDDEG